MFKTASSSSTSTWDGSTRGSSLTVKLGEQLHYEGEGEDLNLNTIREGHGSKAIKVGDCLPYGPRMYYENPDNVVRMKDIGEKNRVLLIGVIGSFTPDCWNRHFFKVLNKLKYYEEREVDYICCVATNDPFTQSAWGAYLGCEENVLMWADPSKRFTKAMGMDIIVPWLDHNIRSKRYVLLADDMEVKKIIVAPNDTPTLKWQCEHLPREEEEEEDEDDDDVSWV